jgi:hypothetical protein
MRGYGQLELKEKEYNRMEKFIRKLKMSEKINSLKN